MGNEQMARTWQSNKQEDKKALAVVESGKVTEVGQAIETALRTRTPNPLAMTFEATDRKTGEKQINPYVRKAGRSVKLQEAAKKKGGIARMWSVCVRSAREKRSDLLDMMSLFPDEYKKQLIESRGGDFRFMTIPDGTAVYKYFILFKNGEKWEGEGIANRDNIPMQTLDVRLDEMAETRAFMRCVGRALADGFINPDQISGSENWTDAESELLAEDQEADEDFITLEADPDGSGTFLTPDDLGEGGPSEGEGGTTATPQARHGQAQGGDGANGAPQDEGDGGGSGPLGAGSSGGGSGGASGGHYASQAPSINDLMDVARRLNVHLVTVAKERYGKGLGQLTDAQRLAIWEDLIQREIGDESAASS